ncbi:MAG TPA: NADH-quinone oxidoreductase subunit A [Bryobacteraceae bacterium]|nr:NADH-quinone oxidoreductase subunit A [Bryobacteraceae bacterium]
MPTTVIDSYFPLLVQVNLALVVAAALVALGVLLGKRLKNKVKAEAYECGITPVGTARERFSVKFYLVAMLFILFDIEAIFLYPWAVVFRELKMFAFIEMAIFIALVLCGLFYVYKKGVLNWNPDQGARRVEAVKVRDAA